jgi:hypothetical protein
VQEELGQGGGEPAQGQGSELTEGVQHGDSRGWLGTFLIPMKGWKIESNLVAVVA